MATPNAVTKIENARYVVTMDAQRRIIRGGALLIEGDRIARVGKTEALADAPADRVIDATGKVVIPGLVNGHVHLSYAHAMRGIFPEDTPPEVYFPSVFKIQAAMTEEEEYLTSLLAMTELVKSGTTTLLDPGSTKFMEAGLAACGETGCRLITGVHVTDRENPSRIPAYETREAARIAADAIDRHHGAHGGRVHVWAMPFSDDWASDDLLVALKRAVDERGSRMTYHHINARVSVERALREYGKRPTLHLEDIGLLGPNVLLAHVIDLDDAEIDAMAGAGTAAVVCPAASLKLAQGTIHQSKLPELLARGVPVSVGTDSANNGNLLETQHAMRITSLVYKDARGDTSLLPASQTLEMGTITGARALGMEAEVGSLESGKKADLVLYDTERSEWSALVNPVTALVYNADGRSVDTVMVDGKTLVEDGKPTFLDERALTAKVEAMSEALLARTGFAPHIPWPVE